jgi:mycobactin peptide synthetase MbtF
VTATDARAAIEDVLALSPLQRGLYSMATLSEHDPYVIAMAADITGELDAGLLHRCAATMLGRHPNLRASFLRGDPSRPVQVIPTRVEVPWRHITATADEVEALDADERQRPSTSSMARRFGSY